jgi:peptidoglycan/LPS O-acetylase OafA/YrhL
MKFRWLSDFDGRRDNNLTLIRFILASAVLFAHSYALTGGIDPISRLIYPHTAIQVLAVDGFFIISGFLVTGSLMNRGPVEYSIRRALRIFPGYWVCLFIFVVVIGPFITNLPPAEYFSHGWTRSHLLRGFYIFNGAQGMMPGAFMDRGRYSQMFNGSLWTLPAEIRCYVTLLIVGFLPWLAKKRGLGIVVIVALGVGYLYPQYVSWFSGAPRFMHLALCFSIGSLAWVYRRWLPLDRALVVAALFLPFLSAASPLFEAILALSLAYLLVYAAFAATHVDLDKFGDVSYGVYIYAWPIQQLVMWPGQGGAMNASLAAVLVFPIATASWFLVERPALNLLRARAYHRPVFGEPA